jgi:hypothetical protein
MNFKGNMDKVLYVKYNDARVSEFKIYTSILEHEGKRYVRKVSLSLESRTHIHQLYENNQRMGHYIDVAPVYRFDENEIWFEYIEGKSIKQDLISGIRTYGLDYLLPILETYRSAVRSLGTVLSSSDFLEANSLFNHIFGCGYQLGEIETTTFACVDFIFDNLIIKPDGRICLIDCEWVFDCQMPLEYYIYRSIRDFFYVDQGILLPMTTIDALFQVAGIDPEKVKIFTNMEDHFQNSIHEIGGTYIKTLKDRSSEKNIQTMLSENKTLSGENSRLHEENVQIMQANIKMSEEKTSLIEFVNRLDKDNKVLFEEQKQLTDERDQLKEENNRLFEEQKQLTNERDQIKEENNRLMNENHNLLDNNSRLVVENKQLFNTSADVIQSRDQWEREYNILKEDYLARVKDLETLYKSRTFRMTSRISKFVNKIRDLFRQ